MKRQKIKFPQHLSVEAKNFYKKVITEYQLEDHHIKILTLACQCLDRIAEAQEVVRKNGSYYTDRWNQCKEHPGMKVERDNKILFARLIRELSLDISAPDSRPPGLY